MKFLLCFAAVLMVLFVTATFVVAFVGLLKLGDVMAQIDDLTTATGVLAQAVTDLQTEVAAVQPAPPPVDLTPAIGAVQSASAAVSQATADLKTKFPGQ